MPVKVALFNMSWVRAVGSAKQYARRVAHAELLPVIMTVCLACPAAQWPGLPSIPKWGRWAFGAVEPYIIIQTVMCQPISRISRSPEQMCLDKDMAGDDERQPVNIALNVTLNVSSSSLYTGSCLAREVMNSAVLSGFLVICRRRSSLRTACTAWMMCPWVKPSDTFARQLMFSKLVIAPPFCRMMCFHNTVHQDPEKERTPKTCIKESRRNIFAF